ncbi:response regulator [Desulforhopalus sp. IMCC35007]|uniref:response regulator n=1 Tax=Desulforhopalus sp. IMCC35007 TaxID=2569543 RepID=UPI00145E5210|nr:response regulator [Desulforhopalus sp. IMCC35007]
MDLNGKTVMLVDDEPAILESLNYYLQRSQLIVTNAKCGEEALAQFRNKPFDTVVTDLAMPGMSGLDVLQEIKKCNPETGVFILTGRGNVELAVQALRLGAEDFIEKPFDVEKLILKLGNYFEKQAALKRTAMYEKILPICAYCKKIRDDRKVEQGQGEWVHLEDYLWKRGTAMSHGCCPDCYEKQIKGLLGS